MRQLDNTAGDRIHVPVVALGKGTREEDAVRHSGEGQGGSQAYPIAFSRWAVKVQDRDRRFRANGAPVKCINEIRRGQEGAYAFLHCSSGIDVPYRCRVRTGRYALLQTRVFSESEAGLSCREASCIPRVLSICTTLQTTLPRTLTATNHCHDSSKEAMTTTFSEAFVALADQRRTLRCRSTIHAVTRVSQGIVSSTMMNQQGLRRQTTH